MTLEQLKSNIKWWESKRWVYNILVGLSGGLGLFKMLTATTYDWSYCDTLVIIIWGIGANLFYSLGTLLELFDWYYLNNRLRLQRFRELLLVLGTAFSCLYTYGSVLIYFISSVF